MRALGGLFGDARQRLPSGRARSRYAGQRAVAVGGLFGEGRKASCAAGDLFGQGAETLSAPLHIAGDLRDLLDQGLRLGRQLADSGRRRLGVHARLLHRHGVFKGGLQVGAGGLHPVKVLLDPGRRGSNLGNVRADFDQNLAVGHHPLH